MIRINGNDLTLEDVVSVAYGNETVELDPSAVAGIEKSRAFVERLLAENRVVYGITTGVGELSNTYISPDKAEALQLNLIRSHAAGVGEPFTEDVVRGIMLLRANALAKGYSGVRKELVEYLLALLNHGVFPYIPSKGSVGASGDLSPLAHLALVVVGEGECLAGGKRIPALDVLSEKGIVPLTLKAKEGLALINGTQVMASLGCLVTHNAALLLRNAQIAGAMSLEALMGTSKAFDDKIHAARPHPGQVSCAANLRRIVADSAIVASHKDCFKVQDAYTLRCMPQVYGAILDTISHARRVLTVEINSATDNPLIFPEEEEVISGGNFHGEPLAFVMDFLGIALSETANISERTVDRLVNPHVSGLPPFLVTETGLNSGFMVAQYTAAALVSENKVLAHPASVDSIPTSAGQEDHVSMGTIAARHAWEILKNVEHVIAIEMLAAANGIDFQENCAGQGTIAAHRLIRSQVSRMERDRVFYPDIEKVLDLITQGAILRAVEEAIGPLE